MLVAWSPVDAARAGQLRSQYLNVLLFIASFDVEVILPPDGLLPAVRGLLLRGVLRLVAIGRYSLISKEARVVLRGGPFEQLPSGLLLVLLFQVLNPACGSIYRRGVGSAERLVARQKLLQVALTLAEVAVAGVRSRTGRIIAVGNLLL